MSVIKTSITVSGAAVVALLATGAVQAQPTACIFSARDMAKSCNFERIEEFHATVASCRSIADGQVRNDCYRTARDEIKDARDTCHDQADAREEVCEMLDEGRYQDPMVVDDPDQVFVHPEDIVSDNPYVSLRAGHTHVLRAETVEEEGEEPSIEIIVVYATDEVREIQGVACRVVADVVLEPQFDEDEGKTEFTAIEVTDDWFAQDTDDNVYYCGEVARNFEDGVLRDLDGSFEAGLDLAKGGLLTLAAPATGELHRQEYALGEAEDVVEYLSGDDATPEDEGLEDITGLCGEAGNGKCLKTFDFSPLEPQSTEYKYYLAGTGFVQGIALEDGEIVEDSREWLVCAGDSLDVLATAECGFGDTLDELLEELCDLHDEFCDDTEDD